MEDQDPDAIHVPDEWSAERAEAVIAFLEAIVEAMHRRYDGAIIALWNDRRNASHGPFGHPTGGDDEFPF
jgi:hypothetical protein